MTTLDDYIDIVEGARELGIHPLSLRRLIRRGVAPFSQHFGKYVCDRWTFLQFKATYDPMPGRKPGRRLL